MPASLPRPLTHCTPISKSGRRKLRAGDVLVIDEAGMLGTELMADLVGKAHGAEAKVILVGDPKQLPSIEAGGLLASLAGRIEIVELVENRRQIDPEERFVAAALRKGLTELAVRRRSARSGHGCTQQRLVARPRWRSTGGSSTQTAEMR